MARQLKSTALETRTIVCLYCHKSQQVGLRAMSLPCKFCHKALLLEDIQITGYTAKRSIETCGSVNIGQKGDVTVNSITCSTLALNGKLKGDVVCSGAVVIGPGAILRGDVTAPSISIAEGAVLKGKYVIFPSK